MPFLAATNTVYNSKNVSHCQTWYQTVHPHGIDEINT